MQKLAEYGINHGDCVLVLRACWRGPGWSLLGNDLYLVQEGIGGNPHKLMRYTAFIHMPERSPEGERSSVIACDELLAIPAAWKSINIITTSIQRDQKAFQCLPTSTALCECYYGHDDSMSPHLDKSQDRTEIPQWWAMISC